jgi:prepilin-type N-terminal cleavage/methylation domain-containing protein
MTQMLIRNAERSRPIAEPLQTRAILSVVRARTGFTLLEIMVALVLTTIVVVVAYAMAQASFDARISLSTHLRQVESARALRELLRDALRNARAPQRPGDPGVVLTGNRLSFVAAGGAAPLDPDYDWQISITPSSRGLQFVAVPLGHAPATQVAFIVPDVTRWDVRMLDPQGSAWLADWSEPKVMPRAVEISFWNGAHTAIAPLHLVLWTGSLAAAGRDSIPWQ